MPSSASGYCFTQGDTKPYFSILALREDTEAPIDLTSCTVTLYFKSQRRGPTDNPEVTGTCVITSPTTGAVEYRWQGTDLNTPGMYNAQFRITYLDGSSESIWVFDVEVKPRLAP